MYRFARRPMWLLSHVLVLALIAVLINLGFWQLRRLDERQTRNDQIRSRIELPVESAGDLVSGSYLDVATGLEFRRVTATGTYISDDEVLVLNRSYEGAPGAWVLTPLALDEGGTLFVNRGWINFALTRADDRSEVAPPTGSVTVEGIVRATQTASGLQVDDPDDGVLEALARPDLGRLQEQLRYPILPGYIDLVTQEPAASGDLPVPVDLPPLDDGPHLSYAFQWFIFSTIAIVGYPLVLRRVARGERSQPERASPGPVVE